MIDVGELLGSLAASGLEAAGSGWPAAPLDEETWAGLMASVRAQRLCGFLAQGLVLRWLQFRQTICDTLEGIRRDLELEGRATACQSQSPCSAI